MGPFEDLQFEHRSDIHGSSVLEKLSGMTITPLYDPAGANAMPLGHNPGDFQKGLAYGVGRYAPNKGHALTFGRTRGGKGVSTIIPALLTYKGSMVVIDPKGENAWITAERRRQLGQRVVILDPWGEVDKHYGSKVGVSEVVTRFNPLSSIDPESDNFADDVAAIAEAFILQTGNDPHWPDSARELVAGLIAAEVQRNPGKASMRAVRKLITAPMENLRAAVDHIVENYPDSVAANKLAAFVEKQDGAASSDNREVSSIRSTARTQTAFLDSKALQASMETDDPPFSLSELATGNVTLYLVLPVKRLKSHGRWLRTILTLAISAIADQETPPQPPVVMLLDELGTISPGSGLPMIEQSYGLMAGLGIRIWAFLQDLPQLQRDYPKSWETFISNSSVIQLLNVADSTTANYFSKYLGTATVNAKSGGYSMKKKQYGPGDSHEHRVRRAMIGRIKQAFPDTTDERAAQVVAEFRSGTRKPSLFGENEAKHASLIQALELGKRDVAESGADQQGYSEWSPDEQLASRPVMFPWEVIAADPDMSIIIMPGLFNAQLKRYVYFTDPVLSKWARPDPKYPVADVQEAQPVSVPPASQPTTPAPQRTSPPANQNYAPPANNNNPPSVAGVASEIGTAVGGWLSKKVNEKLGGGGR